MIRFNRSIKAIIIALVALSLPCSLMAKPVIVSINDTPAGNAVVQVKGAPNGWDIVPDDVGPGIESGIITLFGVDQASLVPDLGWRFVVPTPEYEFNLAVDIVWIQHEGPNGDLQVAFDSRDEGFYRPPELAGDTNAGFVTDEWVTLHEDDTLVVRFKPHTYRLRN